MRRLQKLSIFVARSTQNTSMSLRGQRRISDC